MGNPLFEKNHEGISNYSAALLIQACVWMAVVLFAHKIFAFLPLTLALIFFGFGDVVFRFMCVQMARERGVEVARVSEVLTDQYLRGVGVYDRLCLYVFLYGGAFVAGIVCILCSLVIRNESLLLVGGLCSIAAFLKLVPVYPTDGGLLVVQAMELEDPNLRIVFESAGFIALSILLSIILSPVVGGITLIPALLLPLRYRGLQAKYSLIHRVEEHIHGLGHEISDEELEQVILASPEMKSLELVYEEDDCDFFVETLIQEVPRRPLAPDQRRKFNGMYLMTLCLQMVLLTLTCVVLFGRGENVVRHSLASQNCSQANEDLKYFRPVLELSGKYSQLRQDVSSCEVQKGYEPLTNGKLGDRSPLVKIDWLSGRS
jgi:hypothetical protein